MAKIDVYTKVDVNAKLLFRPTLLANAVHAIALGGDWVKAKVTCHGIDRRLRCRLTGTVRITNYGQRIKSKIQVLVALSPEPFTNANYLQTKRFWVAKLKPQKSLRKKLVVKLQKGFRPSSLI